MAAATSSEMQDLISCRSFANDSRLLGCDTTVIGSGVTSVSKDHSAYKVRQSLIDDWLIYYNSKEIHIPGVVQRV